MSMLSSQKIQTTHTSHPFHLTQMSPWPFTASMGALLTTLGLVYWFNFKPIMPLMLGLLVIMTTSFQWWRDISRESTLQGLHTFSVSHGCRLGMALFIVSEIFFFLSFFWAFFHLSLVMNMDLGTMWPPKGIMPFKASQVPFLNTVILLSSGVSVTLAHQYFFSGSHSLAIKSMLATIALGLYFSSLQMMEYMDASFSIADSIYGSTFFLATGFHGFHVIIGTIFLISCCARLTAGHFSANHHVGLDSAIWYWHFVDVVWLFLFVNIYVWGS